MKSTDRAQGTATILQLAIALALLTILASVAITTYFGRPDVTLQNACELLVEDLRSAGHAAAVRHDPVLLRFLPRGAGYEVVDANGVVITNPLAGGAFTRRYDRDAVFEGVAVERVDVVARSDAGTAPGGAFVFDGDGNTFIGGDVTLAYRGTRQTVTLEPEHGSIDIGPRR